MPTTGEHHDGEEGGLGVPRDKQGREASPFSGGVMRKGGLPWNLLEFAGAEGPFTLTPFSEHKRLGDFCTSAAFRKPRAQKKFTVVTTV